MSHAAVTTPSAAPTSMARHARGTAREALAALERSDSIIVLTFGQFSLGDAIRELLDRTGPAAITLSTWTAAKAEIEHAWVLLADGRITSMRWLVDRSFATRQPAYCAALLERFGGDAIRTTRSHAKWATIRGGGHNFALRTSCNLNANPRLELLEVTDSGDLCDWFDGLAAELWSTLPAGDLACELPGTLAVDDAASTVRMGQAPATGRR